MTDPDRPTDPSPAMDPLDAIRAELARVRELCEQTLAAVLTVADQTSRLLDGADALGARVRELERYRERMRDALTPPPGAANGSR